AVKSASTLRKVLDCGCPRPLSRPLVDRLRRDTGLRSETRYLVSYNPGLPTDRRGHDAEAVVHRPACRDDARGQPQAFAGGLAFETLENAAQPRPIGGGRDGKPVALVTSTGPGADLRPG